MPGVYVRCLRVIQRPTAFVAKQLVTGNLATMDVIQLLVHAGPNVNRELTVVVNWTERVVIMVAMELTVGQNVIQRQTIAVNQMVTTVK